MVAKFCTQCGLELPEGKTCSCTNTPDEVITEVAETTETEEFTSEASPELVLDPETDTEPTVIDTMVEVVETPPDDVTDITPPPPPTPTVMDKAKEKAKEQAYKAKEKAKKQLDATLKQTSDVVGTSCSFLKRFVREPVTALHSAEIKISEAIFFILIGFLGLFAFVAVAYRHAYNFVMDLFHYPSNMELTTLPYSETILGIAFREWIALFFHMLLFYISWIIVIVILGYLYGKFVCKAKKTLTLKGLFTRVVAAKVPMAFMFLLAAIFMLFLTPVAIALAVFGFVIPILLFPFILQPTPNVSINRAVYGTIIIHGLINSLILLYIWNYAYTLLPF